MMNNPLPSLTSYVNEKTSYKIFFKTMLIAAIIFNVIKQFKDY